MRTVFARYGDTFGTVASGADYDIDDVFELVGIVDRLNGRTGSSPRDPAPHPEGAAPTPTGRKHG